VAERESLSVILIKSPHENRPHTLVLAVENPKEQVFERANASQFDLEGGQLAALGHTLEAVADHMGREEFQRQFFPSGDEWWQGE
jgi:hypothetical protein